MTTWPYLVHRNLSAELPELREPEGDQPSFRRLRVFTQDPSLGRLDGAITTLKVANERLEPGPAGSYFVVVDHDEDSLESFAGVDLDASRPLMSDGYDPSTTDRNFACQMVYAVAMETYAQFANALGRNPGFGPFRRADDPDRRLHLVPRAFNEANAFYDRERGAVLFGWERAGEFAAGRSQPGGHVFLSLSHDVIAHEVSHALLDGLRPNFLRPTRPDVTALHEALADLVAVFLHFSQREVVARALERTQGSVGDEQLASIGRQFGFEILDGLRPLRTALHSADLNKPVAPALLYDPKKEEHDLGSVLLSAVFEAYRRVYDRKTRTLRGVFAPYQGRLPVDALDLLATEASRLAQQFLTIVIRAVDYCPSHHCAFGEYLRAMITADYDLVPDDPWGYREALVTSFRRFGITVPDIADLSEESLRWDRCHPPLTVDALRFDRLDLDCRHGQIEWGSNRSSQRQAAEALATAICNPKRGPQFGLMAPGGHVAEPTLMSLRTLRRVAPDYSVKIDLVAEVVQRREVREGNFFGGSTLVIDSQGAIRYAIVKNMKSTSRLAQQRQWLSTQSSEVQAAAWNRSSSLAAARLRRMHRER